MNEVFLRIVIMTDARAVEVSFDGNLSLYENLQQLRKLIFIEKDIENIFYDPYKGVFPDPDIPLKEFEISSFRLLYLF